MRTPQGCIAVVVPAFNEELLITRTLASIPDYVRHIVVVDDASRDQTAVRAASLGDSRVVIVRHEVNAGVGAAITTGYRTAFSLGADVCVVMAGDGQMDPADMPRLLAPILAGQAAYAKGCRLSYPDARKRMPFTRWLGNLGLGLMTRFATGLSVRDSQCGYTAITRQAFERLPLSRLWPRYGYPNDLLGMLAEHGLAVREVTVRPVYADEKSGLGLRHAFVIVPYVLARVWLRRVSSKLLSNVPLATPEASTEP